MTSEPICSGCHALCQGEQTTCLLDLDGIVLTHILARLYDPVPLALTCRALLHALNTQPCKQEWFNRWFVTKRLAEQPLALGVLTWKPLEGYSIAQLSQFCLNVVQNSPALRAQFAESLQEAEDRYRSQRWIDFLRIFVPWPEQTLLLAAAASPHSEVLQQLMAEEDAASSANVDSRLQQLLCSSAEASTSAQEPVSTNNSTTDSAQQHTQSVMTAREQKLIQRRRAQQLLLQCPLPASLHIRKARHHRLQTAVLAAAAAGQQQNLHLLLQRVLHITLQHSKHDSNMTYKIQDLMQGAIEAAAASGSLACLAVAFKHYWELEYLRYTGQLHEGDNKAEFRLQHERWQQDCMQALEALQLQHPLQDKQYPMQQCCPSAADPSMIHDVSHLPQQQWIGSLCELLSNWHRSGARSSHGSSSGGDGQQTAAAASTAYLTQLIQQQRAVFVHEAPRSCRSWKVSSYRLIAAARSGSSTVVAAVLITSDSDSIRQQLPGALAAAGRHGHLEALLLLLQQPDVSSKPLELAAADAAVHSWPAATVDALLHHMAADYRIELLQLLHKPLLKALQSSSIARLQQRQQQQRYVTDAMFRVLQSEAVIEVPGLLDDVLVVLAQQGESSKVSWVLHVAPSLLVKLGPAAAAAALEGGYPEVAQLIMDAGGERPAAFKAAAKRGELTAAVRNKDIPAVKAILTECSLPMVWTCESIMNAAKASGRAAMLSHAMPGMYDPARPGTAKLKCLLNLLKTAAAAGAPASSELLSLLLRAVPNGYDLYNSGILTELVGFCLKQGLVEEAQAVLASAGGDRNSSAGARAFRILLCERLCSGLQLPDDRVVYGCHHNQDLGIDHPDQDRDPNCDLDHAHLIHHTHDHDISNRTLPGALSVALCLTQQAGHDVVSQFVSSPYVSLSVPDVYLNGRSRPLFPSAFIECKKGLTQLLYELSKMTECPQGALVKLGVALYKQMVHVVFEANDAALLHAFMKFMDVHGDTMLADVPEGALEDVFGAFFEDDSEDDLPE